MGASGAKKPVTIGHFGLWTLHELGYADEVRHGTTADYRRPRIFFRLPAGASQGPRNWYLVRLHVRVVLASDSGPGKVDVSATTDSAACALIELRVRRSAGHPPVAWPSVGIVDGSRSGPSPSGTVELRYANYLQAGGVRPGQNELDFQIGQHGSARVAEVRVFDDSGIEFTPLSPANVRLTAERASSAPVHVGERFAVRVAVRNRGERAARAIRCLCDVPDEAALARDAGADSCCTSSARGITRHGSSCSSPGEPERRRLFLSAETSSNHPGDLVTVKIRP